MNRMLNRMLAMSLRLNFNEGGEGDAGSGGQGGEGIWSDSLPEGVRGWDEVKNSDSPEKFWQQIENQRSHLGQSIRIPGPDAGKEDWDAFNGKLTDKVPTLMQTPNLDDEDAVMGLYGRLGRPDKPEGYSIPEYKNDEGTVVKDLDTTSIDNFKALAHAQGLTQKQFTHIANQMLDSSYKSSLGRGQHLNEERAKIKTEWGAAEDQNYAILTTFAAKTDAPENVTAAIKDRTLDAATASWMLQAAKASIGSSARGIDDESGGKPGVMTPSEAGAARAEIMNNNKHPYWNKMDPGHTAAVSRMRELIILQNPETANNPAPGTTFNVGGDQANIG